MMQQSQTEQQDLFNLVQGLQKWLLAFAPVVKITDVFQRNERLSQPYRELNLQFQEDPCVVLV